MTVVFSQVAPFTGAAYDYLRAGDTGGEGPAPQPGRGLWGGGAMRVLTTAALPQLCRHWRPHLGRLITPRHYPRLEETALAGIAWAADNDALHGFDEQRYLAMLEMIA